MPKNNFTSFFNESYLFLKLDQQGNIVDASNHIYTFFALALNLDLKKTPQDIKNIIKKLPSDEWSTLFFKDKTILKKILRQVDSQEYSMNSNIQLSSLNNYYCDSCIFGVSLNNTSKSSGNTAQDNTKYILFIQPIDNTKYIFSIEQQKEQLLWNKLWSIALSNLSTQEITKELLRLVGNFIHAKRILIIEHNESLDSLCCEWTNPQILNQYNAQIITEKKDHWNNQTPYCVHKQKYDDPKIIEFITAHKKIYYLSKLSTLPKNTLKVFKNLNVECLWIFPYSKIIYDNPQLTKQLYIVFEHTENQNKWTNKEQSFLTKVSNLIANIILLKQELIKEQSYQNALKELLSLAEAGICLINKKSGTILYSNKMFGLLMNEDLTKKNCFDKPQSDLNILYKEYLKNKISIQKTIENNVQTKEDNTTKNISFECFLPNMVRWVFAECMDLKLQNLEDVVAIYILDTTNQKEEYASRQHLAIIDRPSGALYAQFGLNLLEEAINEVELANKPLALFCIIFDHYHFLDKSNNPEHDNEMLAFVVRTIKMRKVDCEVIRTNINELVIYIKNVSLENSKQFFIDLPNILAKDAGYLYSAYELKFKIGYSESTYEKRKNAVELLLEAKRNLYSIKNKKENFILI